MRFTLALTLCFFLSGCQTTQPIGQQIKNGMTEAEVTKIVATKPFRIAQFGTSNTWYFSEVKEEFEKITVVRFREGKVFSIEVEDGEKKIKSVGPAPPTNAATSNEKFAPDLGQSCQFDSDCSTKNCWLSQCAGPNNCRMKPSQACVLDSDCCASHCSDGFCR